jgi:putative ABC transport system permease protein
VPLLLAAALVHQSYIRLSSVERGYEAAGRFAVRLALPTRRFADASAKVRGLAGVVERLEAEPGVIAAGYTHHLPVTPGDWTRAYSIDGVMMSEPGRSVLANVRWISPTYFDAIGMRMIRGRTFTEDETDRGADVVVISEGLARKHFGADDPVGRLFKTGAPSGPTPWREIVGVVEQAHEEWAFNETFYVPFGDRSLDFAELVVHVGARATPGTLRAAIREADPDQAADLLTSLQTLQQADLRSDRTGAMIVVALGIAALALSLLGIFGVVSYGVRQRDREMGIRLALGSRGLGLVSLVLREEARPLALGVAIGAVVGVSVLPLVSGRMSSVGESVQVQLLARGLDLTPAALGAVVASVLAAGALASLVPAWRVLSRDPCRALRSD